MIMRDFLSPAYADLSDSFFNEDTDIAEADESEDEVLTHGRNGGADSDPRKTITARDRHFPDRIPDSQPQRDSVEVLPDSQPVSSGTATKQTSGRRYNPDEVFGTISDDSDGDDDDGRITPNKKAEKKTDRPVSNNANHQKKRIQPGSRIKRKPSDSSPADSSSGNARRIAERRLSALRHSDSDNSLAGDFVIPDQYILYENGRLEIVDDAEVHKPRKRRRSGRKKEDKVSKRKGRRQNGHKRSESDTDSDSDAPRIRTNADGEEEEEYVVERILKKRKQNGEEMYFVKWKGYSENENTWEPVENLENCPLKVKEFEEKLLRMKEAGRPTDDVEISEDEDGDEEDDSESVLLYDSKILLDEVLKRAHIVELETIPEDVRPNMECLASRQWITDFLIDDTIIFLLDLFKMNDKVVYLPHHCFANVLKAVESLNYVPVSVLEYLSNQNAGLANVILVCASTAAGGTDAEAEHFALGVIVKSGDRIILLDSIKEPGREPRRDIFKALHVIFAASRKLQGLGKPTDLQFFYSRDSLQQKNNYDCGLYVILNVMILLTRKQVKPGTAKSQLLRRFVYTLMNGRSVQQPPQKRSVPPDDQLMGATKRDTLDIMKYADMEIERKNTNAMVVEYDLLNRL